MYEIVKATTGYASTPTILASFDGGDGASPIGGLFLDASGDLFGTTASGGADGYGTIFEIAKTSSGYASTPTLVASFNGADGIGPSQTLIADAFGDLIGAALYGGAGFNPDSLGYGAIFELASQIKPIPTTNDTTSVIVSTPAVAPTITGTAANQPLTAGSTDTPFSTVTIGDANANAEDTLTITLTGAGTLADGTGFSGLTSSGEVYTLSGTASAITSELDALVFTPEAGTPNTVAPTTFALSDTSSAYAAPTTDDTTSVNVSTLPSRQPSRGRSPINR